MAELTEEEKIRDLAAQRLVGFMQSMQIAQLRLKCAEIVWVAGSQDHRKQLTKYAEELYDFAVQTPPHGKPASGP